MEFTVHSCSDCPMFNGWETYCTHPEPANYIEDSKISPEDCPLRAEKITIYFKE